MAVTTLLDRLPPELTERFEVTRELGRGGMAVVLLAHDRKLDRPVALKLLPSELAPVGAERFQREVRVTARLVHPNIVPLYDSGRLGPWLYYVMPFIDGETVRARLTKQGRLPIPEVVRILSDLGEALAYAHSQGVVHRDLKPENAFWVSERALLADFGIATQTGQARSATLTAHGMIIGTLSYMSPEQASGDDQLDGRTDLYSLGCMAFELLTGEPPFVRETPASILAAHLSAPAPSVADRRPDVPVGLGFVIQRLLAKSPADRPHTAAAFLNELRDGASPTPRPQPVTAPIRSLDTFESPEVRDLCTKGRALLVRAVHGGDGTREKYEMAKAYFESALAILPTSARALVGLADCYHGLGLRGFMDPETGMEKGNELRRRSLVTGDKVSEVHVSLGYRILYWDDDYDTAGLELARAVELDPENSEARRFYGGWLKIVGRPDEALAHMQAAVRLAPQAPFMHVGLADVLMVLGRYDEAVGPLRDALRLSPKYGAALERLEISCHRAGRHEEALDARRTILGIRGQSERMTLLGEESARDGWLVARERDIRRDLAEALAQAASEDPFRDVKITRWLSDKIILLLAELGEWSQAMDWVEKGYLRRPGRLRRVLTDLPFDRHGLALDPRYARLLRTAGLEELL